MGRADAHAGVATRRLKLRALDDDDLTVLSAQLQDAIVPIGDMGYLAGENRFVMVVNRFVWEAGEVTAAAAEQGDEAVYLRSNCGVRFDGVKEVRVRGLDLHDRAAILDLLAIRPAGGALLLEFAGDATVRLDVDRIDCRMEDIGDPWPTTRRPVHTFEGDDRTS